MDWQGSIYRNGTVMKLSEILFEEVEQDMPVVLYHGTLRSRLDSIMEQGLQGGAGWGGAGTHGVYLSGTPDGALYWAKIAYMSEQEEDLEPERFDRKYGKDADKLLVVLEVRIPAEAVDNLRADMEQAEEYGFEGDAEDWQAGLEEIGDVMYEGNIPSEWIHSK